LFFLNFAGPPAICYFSKKKKFQGPFSLLVGEGGFNRPFSFLFIWGGGDTKQSCKKKTPGAPEKPPPKPRKGGKKKECMGGRGGTVGDQAESLTPYKTSGGVPFNLKKKSGGPPPRRNFGGDPRVFVLGFGKKFFS